MTATFLSSRAEGGARPETINRRAKFFSASLFLLLALVGCVVPAEHPSRVPFSKALNFRDAGGYMTYDGQHVRKGVLFRSDTIADLDGRDLKSLARLGLSSIFDLRHDGERAANPYRLPDAHDILVIELSVYYSPLDRAESRRKILSGEVEEGHFRELLIDANRAFALDFTAEWSELLHRLAASGSHPVLIHCVDGKDRTGFAIALILRALGVPQETVMEDYLLSNEFLETRTAHLSFLGSMGSLFRVSRREIRSLLEVRPEYLESAFAAIDEHYGSFEAYLHEGLKLDEDTLARLRLGMLD